MNEMSEQLSNINHNMSENDSECESICGENTPLYKYLASIEVPTLTSNKYHNNEDFSKNIIPGDGIVSTLKKKLLLWHLPLIFILSKHIQHLYDVLVSRWKLVYYRGKMQCHVDYLVAELLSDTCSILVEADRHRLLYLMENIHRASVEEFCISERGSKYLYRGVYAAWCGILFSKLMGIQYPWSPFADAFLYSFLIFCASPDVVCIVVHLIRAFTNWKNVRLCRLFMKSDQLYTNAFRKALALVREAEKITTTYNVWMRKKASEHCDPLSGSECFCLRKILFFSCRKIVHSYREPAKSAPTKCGGLSLADIPLEDYGPSMTDDENGSLLNATDNFSIDAIKAMFDLMVQHRSDVITQLVSWTSDHPQSLLSKTFIMSKLSSIQLVIDAGRREVEAAYQLHKYDTFLKTPLPDLPDKAPDLVDSEDDDGCESAAYRSRLYARRRLLKARSLNPSEAITGNSLLTDAVPQERLLPDVMLHEEKLFPDAVPLEEALLPDIRFQEGLLPDAMPPEEKLPPDIVFQEEGLLPDVILKEELLPNSVPQKEGLLLDAMPQEGRLHLDAMPFPSNELTYSKSSQFDVPSDTASREHTPPLETSPPRDTDPSSVPSRSSLQPRLVQDDDPPVPPVPLPRVSKQSRPVPGLSSTNEDDSDNAANACIDSATLESPRFVAACSATPQAGPRQPNRIADLLSKPFPGSGLTGSRGVAWAVAAIGAARKGCQTETFGDSSSESGVDDDCGSDNKVVV